MFTLQNIRFGHACNSSSYHSLIVFPKGHTRPIKDLNGEYHDYGFGRFTLTSAAAKWGYLGALMANAIENMNLPDYLLSYYIENWMQGHAVTGGVDHQSCINIPRIFNTNLLHKEFFDELTNAFMDERLVVFSGSDENPENSTVNKYVTSKEHCKMRSPLMLLQDHPYEYARKDPKYGHWTLFNPENGCKLRFDFQNRRITKASLPELVDLNITDYCPRACAYCYKSCNSNGKHANYYDVCKFIDALSRMQVFEIAIGGGEPTLHPHFIDILKYCRSKGIMPSFTTKNYEWFHDATNVAAFKAYCGRVAFSIRSWPYKDIPDIKAIIHYHHLRDKVTIQCIDGITDMSEELLNSSIPITILGYKDTGRLETAFNPKRHVPVKDLCNKLYTFGCDTTYCKQYADEIKKAYRGQWTRGRLSGSQSQEIFDSLCTTQEGVYSMYIDAVNHRMAPSSFSSESKPIREGLTQKMTKEMDKIPRPQQYLIDGISDTVQAYMYQLQTYFTEVSERESQK